MFLLTAQEERYNLRIPPTVDVPIRPESYNSALDKPATRFSFHRLGHWLRMALFRVLARLQLQILTLFLHKRLHRRVRAPRSRRRHKSWFMQMTIRGKYW